MWNDQFTNWDSAYHANRLPQCLCPNRISTHHQPKRIHEHTTRSLRKSSKSQNHNRALYIPHHVRNNQRGQANMVTIFDAERAAIALVNGERSTLAIM